jgi:lanosterol synthase
VNGLLTILALWSDNPDDADLRLAVEKLDAWFWEDPREGSRVAGAGSVCWDTSFALQALSALPESDDAEALARGASFLEGQQIEKPSFDYRAAHRIDPSGGWCFSEVGHGWPVSDCTAEALLPGLRVSVGKARHGARDSFFGARTTMEASGVTSRARPPFHSSG